MSDAAVRELAREILARREFASAKKPELADWLRRFLEWVGKLDVLRTSAPVLYWAIIAALVAVLAGLLAHIVWTLWVALRAPEPPAHPVPGGRLPDLAARAEGLAAAGRYLEAAHWLMLASFRALAEGSVIELRPDRSNRWIRGALRGSTLAEGLVVELDSLVERTERRWFGDRRDDPDIYARWRAAFDRLSSQEM